MKLQGHLCAFSLTKLLKSQVNLEGRLRSASQGYLSLPLGLMCTEGSAKLGYYICSDCFHVCRFSILHIAWDQCHSNNNLPYGIQQLYINLPILKCQSSVQYALRKDIIGKKDDVGSGNILSVLPLDPGSFIGRYCPG